MPLFPPIHLPTRPPAHPPTRSELDLLLGVAARLGVRPSIGIRAKLTTRHNGHWGGTRCGPVGDEPPGSAGARWAGAAQGRQRTRLARLPASCCPLCGSARPHRAHQPMHPPTPPAPRSGDRAKFGLRAREIVAAVGRLADDGLLDCLHLLHFHVGSQITNIRMVKGAPGCRRCCRCCLGWGPGSEPARRRRPVRCRRGAWRVLACRLAAAAPLPCFPPARLPGAAEVMRAACVQIKARNPHHKSTRCPFQLSPLAQR